MTTLRWVRPRSAPVNDMEIVCRKFDLMGITDAHIRERKRSAAQAARDRKADLFIAREAVRQVHYTAQLKIINQLLSEYQTELGQQDEPPTSPSKSAGQVTMPQSRARRDRQAEGEALINSSGFLGLLQRSKARERRRLRKRIATHERQRLSRSLPSPPKAPIPKGFKVLRRTIPFDESKGDIDCWEILPRLQRPYSPLKNTSERYLREAAAADLEEATAPMFGRLEGVELLECYHGGLVFAVQTTPLKAILIDRWLEVPHTPPGTPMDTRD